MHQNDIKILSIDMMFKKVRAPSGSLSYPGRTTGADRLNYWLKTSYICDKFVVELSKSAVIQYLNASRTGADRLNYWLKISYICDKFVVELSKSAIIQYLKASRSGSRRRERTKSHL